ncbi:hypothetical protein C8R47DRAFT_1084851 [Mycena vitilis]|nr:hypothetical protein C8R47DRAFT_1084851 [Mycena vitilis]
MYKSFSVSAVRRGCRKPALGFLSTARSSPLSLENRITRLIWARAEAEFDAADAEDEEAEAEDEEAEASWALSLSLALALALAEDAEALATSATGAAKVGWSETRARARSSGTPARRVLADERRRTAVDQAAGLDLLSSTDKVPILVYKEGSLASGKGCQRVNDETLRASNLVLTESPKVAILVNEQWIVRCRAGRSTLGSVGESPAREAIHLAGERDLGNGFFVVVEVVGWDVHYAGTILICRP